MNAKPQGGIKDIAKGRADMYRLALDDLHVKPDWNSREAADPANEEHIDTLARSIAEVGVKEPLTVYWEDGKAWISDGHCRLAAARRANEIYDAEVVTVPVKTEDRYASEAERIFSQIVRNSGKPLTPIEQAKVFKRLIDFGWKEAEIARKAGISKTRVVQLLELQAAPEPVKELVKTGQVSATLAHQTLKEAGDSGKAVETLNEAVETAKARGKTRATAKDIERKPSAKVVLKEIFNRADIDTNSDPVMIGMSMADFKALQEALGI